MDAYIAIVGTIFCDLTKDGIVSYRGVDDLNLNITRI